MTFFPLLNFIILILLYKVHKNIFYITTCVEVFVNAIGIYSIYTYFQSPQNQFLYFLALTGLGAIIAFAAFFIAILLNQKHLYSHHE